MNLNLDHIEPAAFSGDALIAVVFKPAEGAPLTAEGLPDPIAEWLGEIHASKEFQGKPNETVLLHRPQGLAAKRLLLVGVGPRAELNALRLRNAAGAAVRFLKGRGVKTAAMVLEPSLRESGYVSTMAEGALLGGLEHDFLKTSPEGKNGMETLTFLCEASSEVERGLDRGRILASAQNRARRIAAEPANRLAPMDLAEQARKMAEETGLDCEILDRDQMAQLGMGALLGVSQGSASPPAMIVLSWNPGPDAPAGTHLALVGKGVTFDTGGVSIKPSENMDKMKFDMCGAAAVLGAMEAIARLKPNLRVTGLLPAVENMLGPKAMRPGDIVATLSGKTVEVLNTDAEGRLILADAMTYARRLGCTHIVDAATLTGAIVVALGHTNTGVFSNNDDLKSRILAACAAEGEKMWPMPLDEEYREMLKSDYADLPNIGSRWGGAATAAAFLQEFAEGTPWVHLDIAGTAWLESQKPYMAKGPTGVAVRTLARLAEDWK